MNSANCCGVLVTGAISTVLSRSRTSGAASALLISRLSRLMMSRGVAAGASMPYHIGTSKLSIPASFAVGTLGSSDTRLADSTASARANPGKLNFGTGGTGTTTHLAAELLKVIAKIDMV